MWAGAPWLTVIASPPKGAKQSRRVPRDRVVPLASLGVLAMTAMCRARAARAPHVRQGRPQGTSLRKHKGKCGAGAPRRHARVERAPRRNTRRARTACAPHVRQGQPQGTSLREHARKCGAGTPCRHARAARVPHVRQGRPQGTSLRKHKGKCGAGAPRRQARVDRAPHKNSNLSPRTGARSSWRSTRAAPVRPG